jgi:unsaturated chondroitin disaccharide hydrolase
MKFMNPKTILDSGRDKPGIGRQSLTREQMAEVLDLCVRRTQANIKRLADNPESSTWSWHKKGKYWEWNENFFAIGNWTTSFITGMALLAFKQTQDDYFLKQVNRLAPLYRLKVYEHDMDTMHDLGFLYSLYSVALHKLTGDKTHRETGLRAAEVLAGRFIPSGKFIRAWGRMDSNGVEIKGDGFIPTADMAIIDCMMNLPLLHWASAETGDKRFREIAVAHADTTLANFIRPDDSLFHAFRFDLTTGKPIGGENYCGHAIPSHWARGTAWAIYGFALSHSYTRDQKYLDTSLRLARKFIANLDADGVPVWDFKLSTGEVPLRDSSAASIAVCGFQELQRHGAADEAILEAKRTLLARLCSEDYLNSDETCAGLLRNGQVGRALNAYTSWGDYFLMEALGVELEMNSKFW